MTSENSFLELSANPNNSFPCEELGQKSPQTTETTETSVDNERPTPEIEKTSSSNINAEIQAKEKSSETRLTQLPMSRVKNLMKLDPDLQIASSEAAFLVAKATELFINSLAKEAFLHTTQSKKKTMQKKDVDMAISTVDSLMFLDGAMNF